MVAGAKDRFRVKNALVDGKLVATTVISKGNGSMEQQTTVVTLPVSNVTGTVLSSWPMLHSLRSRILLWVTVLVR
jgi:hypothetical protein